MNQQRSSSIATKLVAGLVLALAAFLVFKFVIGVIMTVAWMVAAVVLLVAVVWAINKF
jgi:hypothetical protein